MLKSRQEARVIYFCVLVWIPPGPVRHGHNQVKDNFALSPSTGSPWWCRGPQCTQRRQAGGGNNRMALLCHFRWQKCYNFFEWCYCIQMGHLGNLVKFPQVTHALTIPIAEITKSAFLHCLFPSSSRSRSSEWSCRIRASWAWHAGERQSLGCCALPNTCFDKYE